MGLAGPGWMVDAYAARPGSEHHPVRLSLCSIGGLARTIEWIEKHDAVH